MEIRAAAQTEPLSSGRGTHSPSSRPPMAHD